MYHYIEDKDFLKNMKGVCSDIVNQLVQAINAEDFMMVEAHLVGSGAKNMVSQNASEPIDLDYNLVVIRTECSINDCKTIKEYVKKKFNYVLKRNGWRDCKDSKSCLTTEKRHFLEDNDTEFSIDIAIVHETSDGAWFRLIHKKTGLVSNDEWFWNIGPDSKGLVKKVEWLKENNYWNKVRDVYIDKKNLYLRRNDFTHPSFNCYIEAVNEVYNFARRI